MKHPVSTTGISTIVGSSHCIDMPVKNYESDDLRSLTPLLEGDNWVISNTVQLDGMARNVSFAMQLVTITRGRSKDATFGAPGITTSNKVHRCQ